MKRVGCLGSGITHQRPSEKWQRVPGDGGLQERRQELLVAGRRSPPLAALCLPLLQLSSTAALAPFLTFALVIDGAAHGHTDKAEGIESSPKEEDCAGP